MFDRSFEASPDDLLLSGPVGDILAARLAAIDILRDVAVPGGDWTLVLLFLTASLLQCAIADGEAVTRRALLAYLLGLGRTGLPGQAMRESGLQFCRFVAAEIERLPPLARLGLLRTVLTTLADEEPGVGEKTSEKAQQVRY